MLNLSSERQENVVLMFPAKFAKESKNNGHDPRVTKTHYCGHLFIYRDPEQEYAVLKMYGCMDGWIYLFRIFIYRNTTVGGDATVIMVDGILILIVTSYHSYRKWQDAKQRKKEIGSP